MGFVSKLYLRWFWNYCVYDLTKNIQIKKQNWFELNFRCDFTKFWAHYVAVRTPQGILFWWIFNPSTCQMSLSLAFYDEKVGKIDASASQTSLSFSAPINKTQNVCPKQELVLNLWYITCSRHQSLQNFEFELTKSFVTIFLMILQQTIWGKYYIRI